MKTLACCLFPFLLAASATFASPVVVIDTSMGKITVKLNQKKAPITVKNFLRYVKAKKYDGTIFHRVMNNFMIQGGGFTPSMQQVSGYAPIKNEAANGLKNDRYTIAMARTNDINSATNQFFINVGSKNAFLNHTKMSFGYAVFGKVVSGQAVVDKIKVVPTGSCGYHQNCPKNPVIIKSIRVKK